MAHFYWPGIHSNVHMWCTACSKCQLVNPEATPKVQLHPLPVVETSCERVWMNFVGPLDWAACRHCFILVLVDYAT